MEIKQVAKICHNVNRAYCESIGDNSQLSWDEAPDWQKKSAVSGVLFHWENNVTPEQSHENWMKEKIEDGWMYGETKNVKLQTHPCIVPYNELPLEQRTKDFLFKAVVDSF